MKESEDSERIVALSFKRKKEQFKYSKESKLPELVIEYEDQSEKRIKLGYHKSSFSDEMQVDKKSSKLIKQK